MRACSVLLSQGVACLWSSPGALIESLLSKTNRKKYVKLYPFQTHTVVNVI